MPMHVTVDHGPRLVRVTADGTVTLKDMQDHFDAIVVENAMGYAKLVDCSRIDPRYSDDDMLMLGARLNAYNDTMDAGPLAVFGTSDALRLAFARFTNLAASTRPARLFETEDAARAWLAAQAAQTELDPKA